MNKHEEKQVKYNVIVPWPKLKRWHENHKYAGIEYYGDNQIKLFVNTKKKWSRNFVTLAKFKCINPEMYAEPEKLVYQLTTAYDMWMGITCVGYKYDRVFVGPKLYRKDIIKLMTKLYGMFR